MKLIIRITEKFVNKEEKLFFATPALEPTTWFV